MNRVLATIGAATLSWLLPAGLTWAAPAADLSGDWEFHSKAGRTPIMVDCELRQTGAALAGSCEPRTDDSTPAPFTGSVNGSQAQWSYGVTYRGHPGTVEFDTQVQAGTRMKGTLKLNGKPSELSGEKLTLEARLQRLQDESEIRRRLQDYMPLLRNRDWDHYILMFSKDAEIVMDEGTRHGRADIRERMATASERMAKAAAGKPVRQSADLLTNVEVRVRGDIAHASSRFTFLAENEAHDFVVSGSGLYLDTWVRAGHLLQWTLIALVSRQPQRSCTRNSQRALNRYTGPWRRGARTSFWIPATRRFSTRANTARCRARAAGCENPRP